MCDERLFPLGCIALARVPGTLGPPQTLEAAMQKL